MQARGWVRGGGIWGRVGWVGRQGGAAGWGGRVGLQAADGGLTGGWRELWEGVRAACLGPHPRTRIRTHIRTLTHSAHRNRTKPHGVPWHLPQPCTAKQVLRQIWFPQPAQAAGHHEYAQGGNQAQAGLFKPAGPAILYVSRGSLPESCCDLPVDLPRPLSATTCSR